MSTDFDHRRPAASRAPSHRARRAPGYPGPAGAAGETVLSWSTGLGGTDTGRELAGTAPPEAWAELLEAALTIFRCGQLRPVLLEVETASVRVRPVLDANRRLDELQTRACALRQLESYRTGRR